MIKKAVVFDFDGVIEEEICREVLMAIRLTK